MDVPQFIMRFCFEIGLCMTVSSLILLMTLFGYMDKAAEYGDSRCMGLISGGSRVVSSFHSNWQPDGCDLKIRSTQETVSCLNKLQQQTKRLSSIALVGDSRMRQLRDGILFHLTGKDLDFLAQKNVTINPRLYGMKHLDGELLLLNQSFRIEFIWAPDLESSEGGAMSRFLNRTLFRAESQSQPSVIVMSCGIWSIMRCNLPRVTAKDECIKAYERNFSILLPLMNQVGKFSHVLWAPQNWIYENTNSVYLREMGFNNTISRLYNEAVLRVLRASPDHRGIQYWQSYYNTSRSYKGSLDGVHLSTRTKYFDVQILFNLICNSLEEETSYMSLMSQTRYCCSSNLLPLKLNTSMENLLFFVVILVSVACCIWLKHRCARKNSVVVLS